MSAFIVSNKTINVITAGLYHSKEVGDDFKYPKLSKYDFKYLFEVLEKNNKKEIGKALMIMNIKAVQYRYEVSNKTIEDYIYNTIKPPEPIVFYKALECYRYQCSEGYIMKQIFYKELDKFYDYIAHFIVSTLKKYEQIHWDL